MKARLYIDTVTNAVLVAVNPDTLSDGSVAWNLNIGSHSIPCCSEGHADAAFNQIVVALSAATNEKVKTY